MLGSHLCLHSSGCSVKLGPAWHGESLGCVCSHRSLMEVVDVPSPGVLKPGWLGL